MIYEPVILPLHTGKLTENEWQESWLHTISLRSSLSKHMGVHALQDCCMTAKRGVVWCSKQPAPCIIILLYVVIGQSQALSAHEVPFMVGQIGCQYTVFKSVCICN
jgi:hypothetical protein